MLKKDDIITGYTGREYTLVEDEPLGEGGHAAVWRVKSDDGVECALKILLVGQRENRELKKRLTREIKMLGEFEDNTNVVRVVDWGTTENSSSSLQAEFYVCELIEGENLRARLDRVEQVRLSAKEFENIAKGIVHAVNVIHNNGIAHRDLAPKNVMLDRDRPENPAKVIDFGLCVALDHSGDTKVSSLGTPDYVPPEANRSGLPVDPKEFWQRWDVWQAGRMLYEMLLAVGNESTGKSQPSPEEICRMVDRQDVIIGVPGISSAHINVVMRATANDPGKRYADGVALSNAWREAWRNGSSKEATPAPVDPEPFPSSPTPAPPVPNPTPVGFLTRFRSMGAPLLIIAIAIIVTLAVVGEYVGFPSIFNRTVGVPDDTTKVVLVRDSTHPIAEPDTTSANTSTNPVGDSGKTVDSRGTVLRTNERLPRSSSVPADWLPVHRAVSLRGDTLQLRRALTGRIKIPYEDDLRTGQTPLESLIVELHAKELPALYNQPRARVDFSWRLIDIRSRSLLANGSMLGLEALSTSQEGANQRAIGIAIDSMVTSLRRSGVAIN